MNDDLIYRKNSLMKRRSELLEEIASCADSIAAIDKELQAEHALDGVDPDGPVRHRNRYDGEELSYDS